jgi:predicted nucleotidyltransferase
MEPSFERLLVLLADAGVRFVVVGGVAVTLNGYVRLTEDVDVIVESSDDNILRLIAALSGWGEGYAAELSLADFPDEEGAVRVVEETESCQIDIFTVMSGFHYLDLVADAGTFTLRDHAIRFASKQALLRLKSNSVREKDRIDALALRQLLDRERK